MPAKEPDPRDTVRILDRLVEQSLINERTFREMHHLGGSLAAFRKYCSKITSFRHHSENRRLHEKLQRLLDSGSPRV
jgi:hypothetical protein